MSEPCNCLCHRASIKSALNHRCPCEVDERIRKLEAENIALRRIVNQIEAELDKALSAVADLRIQLFGE